MTDARGRDQPSHATPEGTARYRARHPSIAGVALGRTGLTVSLLGFGCYRVDDETLIHRAALERALTTGVNLIDTSTNYTDGGSERLVGAVLADLFASGRLRRDEVVVVSKMGYVQGQNLALAEAREAAGRPFPEMVKYGDGIWHCLHPEFLADQLPRSLDRLRLPSLDVCLLHNPEYFLSDAAHRRAGTVDARREEFDRRLTEAFAFFEGRVAAGELHGYGVSSNTAAAPLIDPEATSLTRMLAAARTAGGEAHHFRLLQLPMNLFESRAFSERKDGPEGRATVLEWAAGEGVGVLLNRPLNALVGRGMVRLADPPFDQAAPPLETALASVAALEAEYRRDVAGGIRLGPGSPAPTELFRWSEQLADLGGRLWGLTHWESIEGQVQGMVGQVVRAFDDGLAGESGARWQGWRRRYLPALGGLLGALRREAAAKSGGTRRAIADAIDPALPVERRGEPLSRKALWVLASTPGVSTVLLGMRRPAYVEDAGDVLTWAPLASVEPVYAAIRGLRLG